MNHHRPHAIMFHHFSDGEKHPSTQGSLSETQTRKMIEWLSERFNLLGADEFAKKFEQGRADDEDICLSFDDALKCQIDIAVPILQDYGISAFFFVYSGIYSGSQSQLEIYRYFRTTQYENIDEFYNEFFYACKSYREFSAEEVIKNFEQEAYLSTRKYLSRNDRLFRYIRDIVIPSSLYSGIMQRLFKRKNFDPRKIISELWMTEEDIRNIVTEGHILGLHSFNHPTNIESLDYDQQYNEYALNYRHLSGLIDKNLYAMSHPFGRYTTDTLQILNELGITIGFRSDMQDVIGQTSLEIPRRNHVDILAEMTK